MNARDVVIKPVPRSKADNSRLTVMCEDLLNGYSNELTPADPYNFRGNVVNALTGVCKEYNMKEEADRREYADLMARAVAATSSGKASPLILWEEKIKTPDGALVIYVCYVETEKTYNKYLE